jgi:SAM-dependent methyltransferase
VPDPIENLRQFVDSSLGHRRGLRVLEAGCGSASWLDLRDRAHVVGVDISAKQLARNKLIHEAVLGNLMEHQFEEGSFDVIVCIDVLEHLDRPMAAMLNMREALAKGQGLLVLKLPNAMSLKGILTKFTPHGFHVWAFRNLFGKRDAGVDDVGPFKTYMRWSISPRALRRWGKEHQLAVQYEEYYESRYQLHVRGRLGPLDLLVKAAASLVWALSLGRLSLPRTEYVVVFQSMSTPK